MQPLSSLIVIDQQSGQAIYLQLANQLMDFIRSGTLEANFRLPSTRKMAQLLGLHRKTIVQAYSELLAQGWLESHTGSGTFVAGHMPVSQPVNQGMNRRKNPLKTPGFALPDVVLPFQPRITYTEPLHLDDGFPDARMAPLKELGRAYRSQLLTGNSYNKLGYNDPKGAYWLREQLSVYLNESRGLQTTPDNVLIVRGTTMGLYLTCAGLIVKGDCVVVGSSSWSGASVNFLRAGAEVLTVPVDEHGLDTDALEKLCGRRKIRLVYVTSHHHYPTTVALRADRRVKLISLAEKFGFIIFEDDYDYDFHYLSKPLLPLAGSDPNGMVLYCGSFTKSIAPAVRVGYLVGAESVINHFAKLRRVIDRQGDVMLENAVAELLQTGVIHRHLRKSVREYKQRRDFFCEALQSELVGRVSFRIPNGGLAVWTRFDQDVDMKALKERAALKGLSFADGLAHGFPKGEHYTRLGFASSTCAELESSIEILKDILR